MDQHHEQPEIVNDKLITTRPLGLDTVETSVDFKV